MCLLLLCCIKKLKNINKRSDFIPNTETNRIEYKQQLTNDFEQEIIAFLNYKEGGIIYVGINKEGQAVGIDNIDLTQLQIKDRIKKQKVIRLVAVKKDKNFLKTKNENYKIGAIISKEK